MSGHWRRQISRRCAQYAIALIDRTGLHVPEVRDNFREGHAAAINLVTASLS